MPVQASDLQNPSRTEDGPPRATGPDLPWAAYALHHQSPGLGFPASLDLQSTQDHGPYILYFGIEGPIMMGTLKVQMTASPTIRWGPSLSCCGRTAACQNCCTCLGSLSEVCMGCCLRAIELKGAWGQDIARPLSAPKKPQQASIHASVLLAR